MGSSNSAQVTDLVSLYLLSQIWDVFPSITGGLYRDEALFTIRDYSKMELNRLKKSIKKFMKDFFNLEITFDTNYRTINFLDVPLNLDTSSYYPFHKPDKTIQYINVLSNHPKRAIKSIVTSIAIRVSNLSANRKIFN